MKLPIKIVAVSGILLGALSIAGIAYALTAASFESRAQAWADAVCKQSLLDSKNTVANNKTIAICQAYLKGKENGATLASQQLSINNLLNVIPTPGPKGDTGAPGEAGPKGDTGAPGIGYQSLKLYDGNSALLGVETTFGAAPTVMQVYNQALGRKIVFDSEGRIKTSIVAFDNIGCTGDPYFTTGSSYAVEQITRLSVLKNTLNGQNYFMVDPNYQEINKVTRSYRDENNVCTDSTTSGMHAKLIKINLPFVEPLVYPLSFRYE